MHKYYHNNIYDIGTNVFVQIAITYVAMHDTNNIFSQVINTTQYFHHHNHIYIYIAREREIWSCEIKLHHELNRWQQISLTVTETNGPNATLQFPDWQAYLATKIIFVRHVILVHFDSEYCQLRNPEFKFKLFVPHGSPIVFYWLCVLHFRISRHSSNPHLLKEKKEWGSITQGSWNVKIQRVLIDQIYSCIEVRWRILIKMMFGEVESPSISHVHLHLHTSRFSQLLLKYMLKLT